MVEFSQAVPTQAMRVLLAKHLRQSDLDELAAVTDLSAYAAVYQSCVASDERFLRAWFADGDLLCICGCSPVRYGVGAAPWLLATDLLDRHLFSLTRFARVGLGQMLAVYPVLSNVIDARQVRTIRWLEGLGFVVADEPECKKNYKLKRFSKRSA